MFALLFTLLFAMVLVGVGITLSGWFGPRLDDHPHCAKCHYDLTGLERDHCPECGTFIGSKVNVVHSRRIHHWCRMFVGVALITVVAGGIDAMNWWQDELRSRPRRLAMAIRSDDVKTVAAFLRADPKLPDWFGPGSPEELALQKDSQAVLALLLARNPRGQAPGSIQGGPLLHVAVFAPGSFGALLQHGVPVDARGKGGETALHAVMREFSANKALVRTLLGAGADPNARNDRQETPLHLVGISTGAAEVKELIAAGADVDARDAQDRTPLHMAAESAIDPEMVKMLLAAGADPRARDKNGRTPIQYASSNPKVMELLASAAATRPTSQPAAQ